MENLFSISFGEFRDEQRKQPVYLDYQNVINLSSIISSTALKTVFDQIHLEVRQKYSAARLISTASRCLEMWSNKVFRV